MKVYFVGAGPGDPELLTIKGKKILEKVGYCLYAGSLVNEELLGYTRPGTRHYNTHGMSLEEQLKVINEAQERDEDVARLHTGDPSIYGAIQEQMKALDAMGIDYEVNVISAHRTPEKARKYAQEARGRGIELIIAAAGGAAHLPGVLASWTTLPVIGVPLASSELKGVDALYSIVQMPAGIPVATVAVGTAGGI